MEEVELDAQAPVVALPRLFEALEVVVEILLREERGAVDTGELFVVLVAAPVRAGEPGQLERLDRLRVQQMRPAAQVGEVALRVERDIALRGADELDLVRLVLLLEPRDRIGAGDLLARPVASFGELPLHLRLDPLEIGLADRLGEVEVVVEAVLDRRADRDFHAGIQPPHRLSEQVSRGVAEDVERVGIRGVAGREELHALPVGERQPQVARRAVDAGKDGLLGELRADRARGIDAGRTGWKLELRVVGKDDVHGRRQDYSPPIGTTADRRRRSRPGGGTP